MADEIKRPTGIDQLVRECLIRFNIPENLKHYSEMNFREAEKKFVKLCFNGRQLSEQDKQRYLSR
jgi:hypothetical protein